jgi:hypothetical protein
VAKIWYWRHCAQKICFTRRDGEWKILLRSSEAIEVKISNAIVQRSGTTTPGPSIITTLRLTRRSLCSSFWLLRIWQLPPPRPLYSPDLALCHFFLFPKMKFKLKGRRFDSIIEIQTVSQNVIKTLRRNDFQKCFRSWNSHWNRHISAKRDSFEGNWGR